MAEWVRHEGVQWQSGLDMRGGAVAEWVRHDGARWQSGLDMRGCGGRVG